MEGHLPVKPRDPKTNKRSANGSRATQGSKTPSTYVHVASSLGQNTSTATGQHPTIQSPPGSNTGASPRPQRPCSCCGEAHFVVSCPAFQNSSPIKRYQRVISKALCPNCLEPHSFENCRSTKRCRYCQLPHHSMLHDSTLLNTASTTSSSSPISQ